MLDAFPLYVSFCCHIQYNYELQSGVAGPSKCVHLLTGLAYVQHDVDEQCATTDSEEEIDNTPDENLEPSLENEEESKWCH
jgi:hypothetical protein